MTQQPWPPQPPQQQWPPAQGAWPPPPGQQPGPQGQWPPPPSQWPPPAAAPPQAMPGQPSPYALPPQQYGYPPVWGMPAPRPIGPELPPGFKRVVRPTRKDAVTAQIVTAVSALALAGSLYLPLLTPSGQPWSNGITIGQYTPHLAGGADLINSSFIIYFLTTIASTLLALFCLTGWANRLVTSIMSGLVMVMLAVGSLVGLIVLASMAVPQTQPGPAWMMNTFGGTALLVVFFKPRWRAAVERLKPRPWQVGR